LGFAWAWTSLETVGVAAATGLVLTGRRDDAAAHYALQRWWTSRLVDALALFARLRIEVTGLESLAPGPLVVCARHVSIIDSLLPAWLLARAGMRPRFVMKDELLVDPCLDIVGHRIPNHFLDRTPEDAGSELEAITELARGMGVADAAVIFPEGTVVTPERRRRAWERLAAQSPDRARRLATLQELAPVRPAGTIALLRGAPTADVAFVTHRGLESLRRVADAAQVVPLPEPVRVTITRHRRDQIPETDLAAWLDEQWLAEDAALVAGGKPSGHPAVGSST
jgi:1-acyl-sn-glycerol-3-phosphate acyltransferase